MNRFSPSLTTRRVKTGVATLAAAFALATAQAAVPKQPAQWQTPAKVANIARGKQVYFKYCVYCHGRMGKGDGPAGKPLPKNPANFTDKNFMAIEPDWELFKAISQGAGAVGESPLMPAFGYTLNTGDIQNVLAYVRKQYCKCQYDPKRAKEHEAHERKHEVR